MKVTVIRARYYQLNNKLLDKDSVRTPFVGKRSIECVFPLRDTCQVISGAFLLIEFAIRVIFWRSLNIKCGCFFLFPYKTSVSRVTRPMESQYSIVSKEKTKFGTLNRFRLKW